MHLDILNEPIELGKYVYTINWGFLGFVVRFTDAYVEIAYAFSANGVRKRLIKPKYCINVSEEELKTKSDPIKEKYATISRFIQSTSST